MDIESAIMSAPQEAYDYVPRPQPLIVNPDQYETIMALHETWAIERMLRDRFGWGVKPRPALNRRERRKARKVKRG